MSNMMRPQGSLLLDEPPLVIVPSLAKAVGLYPAIVMQQIYYTTRSPARGVVLNDGNRWSNLTQEEWFGTQLGMIMSMPTMRRTFQSLEKSGLIESCQPDGSISRRKYFRIPDSVMIRLTPDRIHELNAGGPCDQFDHIEVTSLITSSLEEESRSPEDPNVLRCAQSIAEDPKRSSEAHPRSARVGPTGEMKRAKALLVPAKAGPASPKKNLKDEEGSNGNSSNPQSRIEPEPKAKDSGTKSIPSGRPRRPSLARDLRDKMIAICDPGAFEKGENRWRLANWAVKAIKDEMDRPELTPPDLERIARGYRKLYPDAKVTPAALAKWCCHAFKAGG